MQTRGQNAKHETSHKPKEVFMISGTLEEVNGSATYEAENESTESTANEISGEFTKPKVKFADKVAAAIAEGQEAFKSLFFNELGRVYKKTGLAREDFVNANKEFLNALENGEYPVKAQRAPKSPKDLISSLTSRFAAMPEEEIAAISQTLGEEDKALLRTLLSE